MALVVIKFKNTLQQWSNVGMAHEFLMALAEAFHWLITRLENSQRSGKGLNNILFFAVYSPSILNRKKKDDKCTAREEKLQANL